MDAPRKPFAWQPFTPRGVAAFAAASLGRLLLIQLIVACLSAGAVVLFFHNAWFPVISSAIQHLPDSGQIRAGRLDWAGASPQTLAENRFLGFSVDLQHTGTVRSAAHLLVECGQTDVRIYSLLGFVQEFYPHHRTIPANRLELAPWWGAWAPIFLILTAGVVIAGLLLSWAVLATLYFLPAWLVAFFANRELTLSGSWRLAGAALIPGALVMIAGIVVYGWGALDLVQLAIVVGAHFAIGLAYVGVGTAGLPQHPDGVNLKTNPFATAEKPQAKKSATAD